ncbi:MAG: hypothetical protein R2727_11710 [Bacteroidales bacterium]
MATLSIPMTQSRFRGGLNTRVVKKNGRIEEIPYRSGGLYGELQTG